MNLQFFAFINAQSVTISKYKSATDNKEALFLNNILKYEKKVDDQSPIWDIDYNENSYRIRFYDKILVPANRFAILSPPSKYVRRYAEKEKLNEIIDVIKKPDDDYGEDSGSSESESRQYDKKRSSSAQSSSRRTKKKRHGSRRKNLSDSVSNDTNSENSDNSDNSNSSNNSDNSNNSDISNQLTEEDERRIKSRRSRDKSDYSTNSEDEHSKNNNRYSGSTESSEEESVSRKKPYNKDNHTLKVARPREDNIKRSRNPVVLGKLKEDAESKGTKPKKQKTVLNLVKSFVGRKPFMNSFLVEKNTIDKPNKKKLKEETSENNSATSKINLNDKTQPFLTDKLDIKTNQLSNLSKLDEISKKHGNIDSKVEEKKHKLKTDKIQSRLKKSQHKANILPKIFNNEKGEIKMSMAKSDDKCKQSKQRTSGRKRRKRRKRVKKRSRGERKKKQEDATTYYKNMKENEGFYWMIYPVFTSKYDKKIVISHNETCLTHRMELKSCSFDNFFKLPCDFYFDIREDSNTNDRRRLLEHFKNQERSSNLRKIHEDFRIPVASLKKEKCVNPCLQAMCSNDPKKLFDQPYDVETNENKSLKDAIHNYLAKII